MKLMSSISFISIEENVGTEGRKWIEYVNEADRSMTSTLVSDTTAEPDFEIVGWRFSSARDGRINVTVFKECRRNATTGVHKAIYD